MCYIVKYDNNMIFKIFMILFCMEIKNLNFNYSRIKKIYFVNLYFCDFGGYNV